MLRQVGEPTVQVVVPVDPEQVPGVGGIAVDAGQGGSDAVGDPGRVGQLGEGGEHDALLAEPVDAPLVAIFVDQDGGQPEAGGVEGGGVEGGSSERANPGIAGGAHARRLTTGLHPR